MKTYREGYFEDKLKDEATVIEPNGGERYEMGNIKPNNNTHSFLVSGGFVKLTSFLPPKT